MNPAYPHLVYNGILLCLNIQLVLVGLFSLGRLTYRTAVLGLLCLFLGSIFIYNLFWPTLNQNVLFNLLVGGQKDVFFGPLIYLYFAGAIPQYRNTAFFERHLLLPFCIYVGYNLIKFGFPLFFQNHILEIFSIIDVVGILLLITYLILTIRLQVQLKTILLEKVYRRYSIIAIGMLSYWLIMDITDTVVDILETNGVVHDTFYVLSTYLYIPLDMIAKMILLIFIMLESDWLKDIMFGQKIYNRYELIEGNQDIRSFVDYHFRQKKSFKNPGFDVIEILSQENIKEQSLRLYLKKEYKQTITNFINSQRVEEFKQLVSNKENLKYDLLGLATEAGFKSRSSFYRNFKNREGISPKQYLDSIIE